MKSDSIDQLAIALAKAQQEIKPAHRDADNPFFKSKYADLTSTWEACKDALNKNGLSVVQTVGYNIDSAWLSTTLVHISGQWISGECPLLNNKGDMQGLGSSISYARRYSLAAICGVTTEDDDGNAAVERPPATLFNKSPGNTFLEKNQMPVEKKSKVAEVTSPSKSNEYVIPLKKFAGKKLSDIPDYEILNYIDWIKREGITKPDFLEFIKQGEDFLRNLKKNPKDIPDTMDDLIPDWVKGK